jgi:hypothetical protein
LPPKQERCRLRSRPGRRLLLVRCARGSRGCRHARIARGSGSWPSARSTSRALERSRARRRRNESRLPPVGRAPAGPREPGQLDERGQPATRPATEEAVAFGQPVVARMSLQACSQRRQAPAQTRQWSWCSACRSHPRATGRRAGLDRCAEDANIARDLAGDDAARSCAQASAQSRLRRMQRTNSCTSSSPRQESAHPVQVAAQSTHSSMLRTSLSRSAPGRCGCALIIS